LAVAPLVPEPQPTRRHMTATPAAYEIRFVMPTVCQVTGMTDAVAASGPPPVGWFQVRVR
jgi:hypothetical protein